MRRSYGSCSRSSPASGCCDSGSSPHVVQYNGERDGYHWTMVDSALLEQVMKLDADSRLELRDAIEASVVDEYLTPERAALVDERVADDDAASQGDYVSLEEIEQQTLLQRAQRAE